MITLNKLTPMEYDKILADKIKELKDFYEYNFSQIPTKKDRIIT